MKIIKTNLIIKYVDQIEIGHALPCKKPHGVSSQQFIGLDSNKFSLFLLFYHNITNVVSI